MPRDAPLRPPSIGAVRLGMTPLFPAPPSCIARPFQDAGNTTRKLIGCAVGLASAGARAPVTEQNAGAVCVAAVHTGASSVTADTRSPIAVTGTLEPMRGALHSISVIVRAATVAGSTCTWAD